MLFRFMKVRWQVAAVLAPAALLAAVLAALPW
jgi:hypothetical protein